MVIVEVSFRFGAGVATFGIVLALKLGLPSVPDGDAGEADEETLLLGEGLKEEGAFTLAETLKEGGDDMVWLAEVGVAFSL